METKTCTKCKHPVDINDFSPRGKKRASWCKACVRINNNHRYATNPTLRKGMRRRHREKLKRNQNYVTDHLKTHPCIDCGETDIIVLDFDHIKGNKINSICKMIHNTVSIKKLTEEIAKCVVRCANDHRRKTAKEQKHFRCGA